jgi:DNA adenine methylase
VKVFGGDYEKVVRKFDSKDTVHFLDPPYVGYDVDVGESRFDEQRFFDLLKSIKGKFLVTYGVRGELPKLVERAGFWTKRIRTRRSIGSMHGVGGSTVLTQLLVANYEPVTKSLDDAFIVEPWTAPDNEPAPSAHRESAFEKSTQLVKGLDPSDERYVLGIVLEPEVVDAQGDIYSAEEIRGAAHRFMEEFGGLGLMHRLRVNGDVKVLESYLAPTDFAVGDLTVRKGTWMLAVRVLSDDLWARVQSGDLTGFSIGGSARRVPEPASASRVEESLGAATEAA